jgi:hypothetical protein
MTGPICAGCGKPLPRPSGRGRPATYHGPACRQRAHRARLTAEPGRAELLALLDRAGLAVAAARRAAMCGDDPHAALMELATVAELANVGLATDVAPPPNVATKHPSTHAPEPSPVTNLSRIL